MEVIIQKRVQKILLLCVLIMTLLAMIYTILFPGFQTRYLNKSSKSWSSIPVAVREKRGRSNLSLLYHPVKIVDSTQMAILVRANNLTNTAINPDGLYIRDTGIIYMLSSILPNTKYKSQSFSVDEVSIYRQMSYLAEIQKENSTQVLRHEYGHALLEDFLFENISKNQKNILADFWVQNVSGGKLLDNTQKTPTKDDWVYPESIRKLIVVYHKQPAGIYRASYYTKNFHEFFAESYARYLSGEEIPTEFKTFFDALFR